MALTARRSAGALVAALLLIPTAACGSGSSNVPGQNLLDLINQKRADAGCAPVQGDEQLRRAAERHVVDTRDHPEIFAQPDPKKPNYRDPHVGSDGSTVQQRINAAGYTPASRVGEIAYVALGAPDNTAEANIRWWMESEPHRAIIETCEFTHAGVGLVYPDGKWFSVVDFGAH
jgi:uncharacterized protein YkwD